MSATATSAGAFNIGGDLEVTRLGYTTDELARLDRAGAES
jgi:hypothetical protein